MQGMVEGKRGKGRPRKCWMDDITQWTGLSVQEAMKAAQKRLIWKKIVHNAAHLISSNQEWPKIR